MINLSIIKENYASMPVEKLIRIVKEDTSDLVPEAFELLKEEFTRRQMDINDYLPSTDKPEEEEPLPEFVKTTASADEALMGLSYQKMMYKDAPEEPRQKENKESLDEKLTEEDISLLINKCNRNMLIYAGIFIVGFVITMVTFFAAAENGSFLIAFGPIFFGGIGFFRAFERRNNHKALLAELKRRKEGSLF